MKQEIKDYANFQLEKSRNTFAEAKLLYSNNYFTGAVNRIYYSVNGQYIPVQIQA